MSVSDNDGLYSNLDLDNDDFNQIDGNVSAVTVLLEDKGISWGSYQEDMVSVPEM
jgi:phospholipase C